LHCVVLMSDKAMHLDSNSQDSKPDVN